MRFMTWMGMGLLLGHAWVQAADVPQPAARKADSATVGAVKAAKYTSVEGITEYRLPNGLRVLLAPDASKPTTTVNVTYLVGSRHENYGETGMAHLLEHLVFKGTPKLPGKTIVQEFARRGMRMNGSTFYDRTNYFETFAACDDILGWALNMEADRMVYSFVAKSYLDTEMSVVRNEMESGENDPMMVLWQTMTATAYQWHNYGKSTIGARSDVENVKIGNLQAFYRKYYQPDNAVLIVTGQFNEAATLARIARYFGPIPKPSRVLPPEYTLEPVQDGARQVTVSRVGDANLVATQYHSAPGAHADAVNVELLAFVLADTPTGRLHKALVDSKKAASVTAMPFSLKDPGYVFFLVNLNKTQSREDVAKVLVEEVEQLASKPITAEELARAKTSLLNEFENGLSDPVNFGVSLSESIATGDWRLCKKPRKTTWWRATAPWATLCRPRHLCAPASRQRPT
jgi:zinc protease